MELNELTYFIAVAETENSHRAAENIGVTPSAISKAVSKLEHELGVKLFYRVGRGISLTKEGRYLKSRAHDIINLTLDTKLEIIGKNIGFKAIIGANENLLSHFGTKLGHRIHQLYPEAQIIFQPLNQSSIKTKVSQGELHIGLSFEKPEDHFDHKVIANTQFYTVVGLSHLLHSKRQIKIENLLQYNFVSSLEDILGPVKNKQSKDGWRDDLYPRKITYLTNSLKSLIEIIENNMAIGYLPEYLINPKTMKIINVSDCHHTCKQKIYMYTKDKKALGWINQLF
jgi:DNA-binding transcriptional LysR family regulator